MSVDADVPGANTVARKQAFDQVATPQPQVPGVTYVSSGQLLIIGTSAAASAAAEMLAAAELGCVLLITDSGLTPGTVNEVHGRHAVHGQIDALSGYLGAFQTSSADELLSQALKLALPQDQSGFDLILDLSDTPYIKSEIPPPGYYAVPQSDAGALREALEQIPGLVGEFEKPRYFRYNASICAHGRSGIDGCNRCIETCPTDAISGNGDVIEVNPNLCQGAGSCATSCPSGAITYGYPAVADTLQYWRALLRAYRAAGGATPVLLVHDAEDGRAALEAVGSGLGGHVLPVEVEEIGSVGADAWLAAIAWGATAVRLLVTPGLAASVHQEVSLQVEVARAILQGLGYAANQLQLVGEVEASQDTVPPPPAYTAAEFAAIDEKRTLLRLAIDHLAAQSPQLTAVIDLPQGAAFGAVAVDGLRCTLCMACVSQCPANALAAGDDSPQVRFVEAKCLQCGICARSCPESAITLSPRLLTDAEQRNRLRTLHADEPFCCIRCNKPFATRSVIARITEKVKDHPMFSGPALERLKMCEDCRVKDIYSDQEAMHE